MTPVGLAPTVTVVWGGCGADRPEAGRALAWPGRAPRRPSRARQAPIHGSRQPRWLGPGTWRSCARGDRAAASVGVTESPAIIATAAAATALDHTSRALGRPGRCCVV